MSIFVICPVCYFAGQVSSHLQGKLIQCKHCRERFVAGGANPAAVPQIPAPAPALDEQLPEVILIEDETPVLELVPEPVASVADELRKLAALKQAGVLTEQEFQQQKRKLLG